MPNPTLSAVCVTNMIRRIINANLIVTDANLNQFFHHNAYNPALVPIMCYQYGKRKNMKW